MAGQPALKLAATQLFAAEAEALPELAVPLAHSAHEWDELRYEEFGPPHARVGWLEFDVHNGAFGIAQCNRLREALHDVKRRDIRVLVLAGGADFFSNGIDLNAIEAAAHRPGDSAADASWRNIEAIDDAVLELLSMTDRITVAALRGNAGAGGCFVALAADRVWAHGGVILNPHYKNMGNLYGSEYWTYMLPRRVGADDAARIMRDRLPLGAHAARTAGIVDAVLAPDAAGFDAAVRGEAWCWPRRRRRRLRSRTSAAAASATRPSDHWRPIVPMNCSRCSAISTASTRVTTSPGTTSSHASRMRGRPGTWRVIAHRTHTSALTRASTRSTIIKITER